MTNKREKKKRIDGRWRSAQDVFVAHFSHTQFDLSMNCLIEWMERKNIIPYIDYELRGCQHASRSHENRLISVLFIRPNLIRPVTEHLAGMWVVLGKDIPRNIGTCSNQLNGNECLSIFNILFWIKRIVGVLAFIFISMKNDDASSSWKFSQMQCRHHRCVLLITTCPSGVISVEHFLTIINGWEPQLISFHGINLSTFVRHCDGMNRHCQ